jgi:hypothetical protein
MISRQADEFEEKEEEESFAGRLKFRWAGMTSGLAVRCRGGGAAHFSSGNATELHAPPPLQFEVTCVLFTLVYTSICE